MDTETKTSLWKSYVLPLLFFALISLVMVGPHVVPITQISPLSYDPADAYIFLWNFWWTKSSLLQLDNPYWTDLAFYPYGTSLSFHSYPLPYSILSIPIQYCVPGWKGVVVAYHVVILLSFALSGFGAYRLALYVARNQPAAIIAGLIFAFMPFHILNMSRLHVLAIEFLPFYVHALLVFRDRPVVWRACHVGAWMALTYYTSLEYALYLVMFSLLWLMYVVFNQRKAGTPPRLGKLGLSAVTFVLLTSPLLYQQAKTYASGWYKIERPIEEAINWSPALVSFVTPSRVHPVYGEAMAFAGKYKDQRTKGMRSETTLGLVTLGLAAVAMLRWRRSATGGLLAATGGMLLDRPVLARRARQTLPLQSSNSFREGRCFWAIAAVLFLSLTLGPYLRVTGSWMTGIPMPWLGLYHLFPPFRGGREPARILPLAMLMFAMLAALGVREILQMCTRKRTRIIITLTIAALVLFEDLTTWSAKRIEPHVHAFYSTLANEAGDFAIMDLTPEMYSLLAQTVHGKRSVEWRAFVVRSEMFNRETPFVSLEEEFNLPQVMLNLDPESQAEKVNNYRHALGKANVRYILFPAEAAQMRIELAKLLCAHVDIHVDVRGSLVVCKFNEFPSASLQH